MIEPWKREHDLWMAYSQDAEAARLEAIEAAQRYERLSNLANEHKQIMESILGAEVQTVSGA